MMGRILINRVQQDVQIDDFHLRRAIFSSTSSSSIAAEMEKVPGTVDCPWANLSHAFSVKKLTKRNKECKRGEKRYSAASFAYASHKRECSEPESLDVTMHPLCNYLFAFRRLLDLAGG